MLILQSHSACEHPVSTFIYSAWYTAGSQSHRVVFSLQMILSVGVKSWIFEKWTHKLVESTSAQVFWLVTPLHGIPNNICVCLFQLLIEAALSKIFKPKTPCFMARPGLKYSGWHADHYTHISFPQTQPDVFSIFPLEYKIEVWRL